MNKDSKQYIFEDGILPNLTEKQAKFLLEKNIIFLSTTPRDYDDYLYISDGYSYADIELALKGILNE